MYTIILEVFKKAIIIPGLHTWRAVHIPACSCLILVVAAAVWQDAQLGRVEGPRLAGGATICGHLLAKF